MPVASTPAGGHSPSRHRPTCRSRAVLAVPLGLALAGSAAVAEPDVIGFRQGTLPRSWDVSAKCAEVPDFQVHEYNPDLYILRQSGCSNDEKPFLYLLFGDDKALLLDTDAGSAMPRTAPVDWSGRSTR